MNGEQPNLKEQQVADFFGVSVKTVRSWRFKGIGPTYYKANKNVRYALKDVQEYAESNRITARR